MSTALLTGFLTVVAAMFLLAFVEAAAARINRRTVRVLTAREADLQARIAIATALNQRLKEGQ